MTAPTAKPTTKSNPALALERFFEHVRLSNPFDADIVRQVGTDSEPDAAVVHQAQFRQLTGLARDALGRGAGLGALLWGDAGVGKSHLLSRLARWAYGDGNGLFVYLQNLQSCPDNLPRSLLRVAVSILTGGRQDRFGDTPLFRLVDAAARTVPHAADAAPEKVCAALLDRLNARSLGQPALVDRTAYEVLFRFRHSAAQAEADGLAAVAVRWLSGDPLDAEEARRLRLPPTREEIVTLADDQQIKLVLVALGQIAQFAGQPFLLCLDQIENIDAAAVSSLTRFLQAVLDSAPNLLLVTCGVHDVLGQWLAQRVIHTAAWDRIAQFEIMLPRVTPHEARQILDARLDGVTTPFMEVGPIKDRVLGDRLFPLGSDWFAKTVADKLDLRPRDVIRWARAEWASQQRRLTEAGGPAWLAAWSGGEGTCGTVDLGAIPLEERIDRKVAAKVAEQKAQRQIDPTTLPPDGDNLAGLTYALLRQCLDAPRPYALTSVTQPPRPSPRQRPTFHLLARRRDGGADTSVGVLFLTTGNATSTAAWIFRRVLEDRKPPEHLLLVTDQRRPLRLGPKGQDYLDQLRRNYGGRFAAMDLTFGQYADLDALEVAAGMARSGDLEIDLPAGEVRRVTEAEVVASHHRCDRYAAHALLRTLLGATAEPPAKEKDKVIEGTKNPIHPDGAAEEQDARQFIAAQLGLTFGASGHELAVKYADYLKATKRPTRDLAACLALIKRVALTMHAAGEVQVTPLGDDIHVMPRRRQA